MRAFMFLKYYPLAKLSNNSRTLFKTSTYNFKFSTKNIFNSRSKLNQDKGFISVSMKGFVERGTEKTLYLNDQEAYILNEHDRMLIQITSNVVPMTAVPKFMKELLEYCFLLSKYKDYIKGWNYVAKFFHENLKNFTNEELDFYIAIFSMTAYVGETSNFWKDLGAEVLSRNLDKQFLFNFLGHFASVNKFVSSDFFTAFVKKFDNINFKDFSESIHLASLLGIIEFSRDDPIWQILLSNVENQEIVLKEIPVTFLLRAANSLKENVKRDSPFYEKIRVYLMNNFQSIPGEFIPTFCNEFIKFAPPSDSDLLSLIIQSLSLMTNSTQNMKFEFYKLVLRWCNTYPSLRQLLEQNKNNLGDFVVPSADIVRAFSQYEYDLKSITENEKLVELHNNFWLSNAELIGFKIAFAQNYSINGVQNYTAIEESLQKVKPGH